MTGIEYFLLHAQEPILYVIRKQARQSPTQAHPLTDYYVVAGTVYQAPDLVSVINSRLVRILYINGNMRNFLLCFNPIFFSVDFSFPIGICIR